MRRLHEKKIDDAKYYEKIWSIEHNTRPYYDAVRQRALIKYVKDGDKVADVGAGVFGSCQYIAENTFIDAQLYCIDQSYTAKEIVDSKNLGIEYIIAEVEKFDKKYKEYFDVVIGGEIIEHMENPKLFAKELIKICKKGGWVCISTVNTKSENAIKHGDYPEHLWEFEPEDLISFFKPYGDTTYEVCGDYHMIYCKKHE